MIGFSGWVGTVGDHTAVLDSLAEGISSPDRWGNRRWIDSFAGLVSTVDPRSAVSADRDVERAVLIGDPWWGDSNYSQLSVTDGPAAALIAAYSAHGKAFLNFLHGDFALAVIDPDRKRVLLAVDRFGIRTLNYSLSGPVDLVFGTSADAVRAFPGMPSSIDPQSVYNFLHFVDRIPAPGTIYKDQRKLWPGECLEYVDGQVTFSHYWSMPYVSDGHDSQQDFTRDIHHHLRTALKRNVYSEKPAAVGAFLSGGLDSSTVVGLMLEAAPDNRGAFTIGFDDPDYDETPFARIAADHFSCKLSVYRPTPADVLEVLVPITEFYDEPFSNSSVIPAYFAARMAKEAGTELMLAGDGGDELFGGNSRYLEDDVFDYYARLPQFCRRGIIEPLARAVPHPLRRSVIRKATNYIRLANMTPAERMIRLNLFYYAPVDTVFSSDALSAIDLEEPNRLANALFDSCPSEDKLHRMFQFDMQVTLADSDLRKVSRMCEMAGVRVKYPFLDDDVAAFSASVSPSLLMSGGQLRHAYKEAMKGFLPDAILTKKKHGFGLPFAESVAHHKPLLELVCDNVDDLKTHGFFRNDFLDEIISLAHAGETGAYLGAIWDLACLQIWLRSRGMSL